MARTAEEKRSYYRLKAKEWKDKNPERHKEIQKKYLSKPGIREHKAKLRDEIRAKVIAGYGGECVHCLYSYPDALAIDHVNNDGHVERKNGIAGGTVFYRKLIKEGFPKDRYQLLCYNCNHIKEVERQRLRRS